MANKKPRFQPRDQQGKLLPLSLGQVSAAAPADANQLYKPLALMAVQPRNVIASHQRDLTGGQ